MDVVVGTSKKTGRKEFHIHTKQNQVCHGSNVTCMTRDRTAWKKDCSGLIDTCKTGVCMGSMQTDRKVDRVVQMLLLACDEVFLSFVPFCSVPNTIALYSVGLQLRCSCFASCVRTIMLMFWTIDRI